MDIKETFENNWTELKSNLINSRKYWILYLLLIVFFCLIRFGMDNYATPKLELMAVFLISVIGVLAISYYKSDNKGLYKTAFVVILIFGIICSVITPICIIPDEIEHFARADITASGDFFPHYVNNSFKVSQSVLDLTSVGVEHLKSGAEKMSHDNSSIMHTDADTKPINDTKVPYRSAFAQNPFFGYLPQALGIVIAKLLDLNAIWMLWLGRMFNVLLYAGLAAIAIRKTPILKVPMFVMACIPAVIYIGASMSIDSFINGMGLIVIAYFFSMYKSPKGSLNQRDLIIYSLLVLLMGMCKVTCFAFILLLLFLPRDRFEGKNYYYGFIYVVALAAIAMLWSKFYANPGFFESYRVQKWAVYDVNSTQQINYMLSHKTESIIEILRIPNYFENDLAFSWVHLTPVYLMFLGAIGLLYPHEKINLKSKVGALIVLLMVYVGTYIVLLLTWTPVGQLNDIAGVQARYFYTLFPLIPFIFGFNHMSGDKLEMDNYIIAITIAFVAFTVLNIILGIY